MKIMLTKPCSGLLRMFRLQHVFLLLVLSFAISDVVAQKTNTFPDDGNAGIGTTTPGNNAITIERSNSDGISNMPVISIKNTSTLAATGSTYNVAGVNYVAVNGQVIGQIIANYGVGASYPWDKGSGDRKSVV